MILEDVAMLASPSNRTKLYLLQMAKHELLPALVMYMDESPTSTPEAKLSLEAKRRGQRGHSQEFDLDISVLEILKESSIRYQSLPTQDPNSDLVADAVAACPQSIIVYSGPGGAILRSRILATGKRFLHTHSGVLPDYRGSTTLYYSLLREGTCGAAAFFIDEQIDTGPIVRQRIFPAPQDRTTIDLYYDPLIRSKLLVEVMKDYVRRGEVPTRPQSRDAGETYFIIHPVLKHIAILAGQGGEGQEGD